LKKKKKKNLKKIFFYFLFFFFFCKKKKKKKIMNKNLIEEDESRQLGRYLRAHTTVRPGAELVRRERSEFAWPCDAGVSAQDWARRHMPYGAAVLARLAQAAVAARVAPSDVLPATAFVAAAIREGTPAPRVAGRYAVPSEDSEHGNRARLLADKIARAIAQRLGDEANSADGAEGGGDPVHVDPRALSEFFLMAWTNALEAEDDTVRYGALFPAFSKLTHSCAPNTVGTAEVTYDLWDSDGADDELVRAGEAVDRGDGDGDDEKTAGDLSAGGDLNKGGNKVDDADGGDNKVDDDDDGDDGDVEGDDGDDDSSGGNAGQRRDGRAGDSWMERVRGARSADRPRIVLVTVRAIEAMDAGEVVSVSYLAPLDLCLPTADRCTLLETSKFFACRCVRCAGADTCNVLPCPLCRGPCVRSAAAARHGHAPWRCKMCDAELADAAVVTAERATAIREIGAEIRELRDSLRTQRYRGRDEMPITILPRVLAPLRARAQAVLGINHAYTALAYFLTSTFHASLGNAAEAAAEMAVFLDWQDSHVEETCPSAGLRTALGCMEDLRACGRTAEARDLVRRRIPLMRAAFGPYDSGVVEATRFVLED
jgi:hypothetical protein